MIHDSHQSHVLYFTGAVFCALIIIALERTLVHHKKYQKLSDEINHLQELLLPLADLHPQQEKLILENQHLTNLLTTMRSRLQHQKTPSELAACIEHSVNDSIKINSCTYFYKKYFILKGVALTTNSFTQFLSALTTQNTMGPITVLDTRQRSQELVFTIKIGSL